MIRAFYSGLIGQSGATGRRGRILLRALVSTAILAALLWWLPAQSLLAAIAAIPAPVWLFAIAGFLAGHLVSAFKWRLLLGAVGVRLGGLEAVRAHAAGLFANLCLPSVIGGDVVRAGIVMRKHKRYETIALGSLADRINDSFALVLIAAFAALLIPASGEINTGYILSGLALLLAGAVIAAFVLVRLLPVARLPGKVAGIVLRIREALDSLLRAPGTALLAFLLSVAIQSGFILLNLVLARYIGITAQPALWFFAWPLAKLIALAPVSLGGIGVREVAIAGLLAPFGLAPALVVAQSLSWEVVLVISGLLAGALAVLLPGQAPHVETGEPTHD